MYGKFFAQTFTGSMMGAGSCVFAVWGYVIANCKSGAVELNPKLLAVVLGEEESRVLAAIEYLCAPDEHSRSPAHEGRRLLKTGAYLYEVPSHDTYRKIINEDERREYLTIKKRESRARLAGQQKRALTVDRQSQSTKSTPSTHTEAEGNTDTIQSSADPRFASVTAGFSEAYKREFGEDYAHKGGRDGNALKKFLKGIKQEITAEQIVTVIGKAMAHRKTTYAVACKRAATIHGFCDGYNEIRAELKAASESNGSAPHRNGHATKPPVPDIRLGIDRDDFRQWLFTTYPRAKSDLTLETVPVEKIAEYRQQRKS